MGADALLDSMDVDGDGMISFDEFVDFICSADVPPRQSARRSTSSAGSTKGKSKESWRLPQGIATFQGGIVAELPSSVGPRATANANATFKPRRRKNTPPR